jgi:hypothetical protein
MYILPTCTRAGLCTKYTPDRQHTYTLSCDNTQRRIVNNNNIVMTIIITRVYDCAITMNGLQRES